MGLLPHLKPRGLHQLLRLVGETSETPFCLPAWPCCGPVVTCFLRGEMCHTCLGVALILEGSFQGLPSELSKGAALCPLVPDVTQAHLMKSSN